MSRHLFESLEQNQADLYNFIKQKKGLIPKKLTDSKLDKLITTKKDNIKKLKVKIEDIKGQTA